MTKIPHALAKALEASLPTLVLDGRLFFRRRLTHARGGSNSVLAPAPPVVLDLEGVAFSAGVDDVPLSLEVVVLDGLILKTICRYGRSEVLSFSITYFE